MDLVSVGTIAGAAAAVGALAWAMVGNPNLLEVIRDRPSIGGQARGKKREIILVSSKHLEAAVSRFVTANNVAYDLVVGLHPDGVSIASSLARKIDARFCAVEKIYPGMRRSPFFVFQDSSQSRSHRESTFEFLAPTGVPADAKVLIVDGVTTFGNALSRAREQVLTALPSARVDFYVYAVDEARLHAANGLFRLNRATRVEGADVRRP
jgi:adenine/guanine phosphoribosyltransferase-like PRPP-binding protein